MQDIVVGEKRIPRSTKWFHFTYLLDWLIVLIFLVGPGLYELFLHPRDRYLPPNDPSVSYPRKADIVSNILLLFICWVLPMAVFLLMQYFHRSKHDLHHSFLGFWSAIGITFLITQGIKFGTGRYRPYYLNDPNSTESRLSFPSGHASISFAAMTFVCLYLSGKLQIYSDSRGVSLGKGLIALSPLGISIFITVSRVLDYHHHFSDIIAGSLIGTGVSFFCYFIYYPSLFSHVCHIPKNKYGETLIPVSQDQNEFNESDVRLETV